MKSYQNAIAALVLAIVFSASAYAGDGVLHTDKTPPPPPPPLQTNGVLHMDTNPSTPESDALTEIVLNLLQNLLRLR